MSTAWFVHCSTCNCTNGSEWDNHEEVPAALIANRDKLVAVLEAHEALVESLGVRIDIESNLKIHYQLVGLTWFRTHRNHELVVKNEYGHVLDQCAVATKCGSCGASHPCVLKRGHLDDHRLVKEG
jgi:hypothetical protein